LLLYPVT
jgi:hypothetical protein